MFVFVCFLVVQMSVITWGFTSKSRMGHYCDEFICWSSLLLSPWLWCVIQSPLSVFLNLDKLKSKHPLLQSKNSHICLGPHSPFSMIQQVCPRQYGGSGGRAYNIFHRLFSAAIYSDKWRDKLGTSGAGPGQEEEVWDKEGASWPNVTCY